MLGSIRVISMRKGGDTTIQNGEKVIRIDRANPVFGNPHILHNHTDDLERDNVIAAYIADSEKDYAEEGARFKGIQKLSERVLNGEKLCLACWCAPKPCHGDWIVKKVKENVDQIAFKST